jgi:hypothetical protein
MDLVAVLVLKRTPVLLLRLEGAVLLTAVILRTIPLLSL